MKLDSRGTVQWKRVIGGSSSEACCAIAATTDDGYVLTGSTRSNDRDFTGMNKGREDIFVINLDVDGDAVWQRLIGGLDVDYGSSIATSADGGCVITDTTTSTSDDFAGMNNLTGRIFVMKLDTTGQILWKRSIGGTGGEVATAITTTPEGGYVLTGSTAPDNGDFTGLKRVEDALYILKLDDQGSMKWTKVYDGNGYDKGRSITTISDGGCVVTGYTTSTGGDFLGSNNGSSDIFIIKVDPRGDLVRKNTFGGSTHDLGLSLIHI